MLVSSARDAVLEADVGATPGGIALADLARANIGLNVRRRRSIGMEAFAEKGTPLYRTLRVSQGFLGRPHAELAGEEPVPDKAFEDVPLPVTET